MPDTPAAPDLTNIPIAGSSVPGDPDAAYRYAHRLERAWQRDQLTIIHQRQHLAEQRARLQVAGRLAAAAWHVLHDLERLGLQEWPSRSEGELREAVEAWELGQ